MADKPFLSLSGLSEVWAAIKSKFQEKLVSGKNIKTINNSSILGSGNINITSGVSGVKGDAESSYRTGQVNLTPANIGALPLSGGTLTGALNTANNTPNKIGDDSQLGDFNVGGIFGVQALNGTETGIALIKKGENWNGGANYAKISYDGTTVNINKPTKLNGYTPQRLAFVGQSANTGTKFWYKVAEANLTRGYQDVDAVFLVTDTYSSQYWGILRVHARRNNVGIESNASTYVEWIINKGYKLSDFVLVTTKTGIENPKVELWKRCTIAYSTTRFKLLSEGDKTVSWEEIWTLYNTYQPNGEETYTIGDNYQAILSVNAPTHSKQLTQSQYDALPSAEKNDGTVYFITDGTAEDVLVNDSVPIGAIQAYAGTTAPTGWIMCNGQAVSRSSYSELFATIGTTYGSGDGSTTFNVPDLRGRVAIGSGTGTATDATTHALGSKGGEETHTLVKSEMPSHYHNGHNAGGAGTATSKFGFVQLSSVWNSEAADGTTGGDQPHNNLQPYLTTNYIIKAKDFSLAYARYAPELTQIFNLAHPIGTIYETMDSAFNPGGTWGGTWSKETITDDYIVEEATSGIWTYRKWASGVAECWGAKSKNTTSWVGWNAWTRSYIDAEQFPTNLFSSTPTISMHVVNTSGSIMATGNAETTFGGGAPSSTSTGGITVYSSDSGYAGTTKAITIYFIARGLWKVYTAPSTKYKWHRTA